MKIDIDEFERILDVHLPENKGNNRALAHDLAFAITPKEALPDENECEHENVEDKYLRFMVCLDCGERLEEL